MPNTRLLFLAALCTSFGCSFALQESAHAPNAAAPCGFELVWPSSDSIVLLAARSLTVEVVLKLWGNCSAFLHPVSPSRSHLKIAFLGYAWWWDRDIDGPISFFEPVTAVPLGLYWDVSSAALSSSPLLFQSSQAIQSGDLSQLPWDVAGRHDSAFSLWTFNVQYMKDMLKPNKAFETSNVPLGGKYCHTFEFHLQKNLSTPVTSAYTWPVIKLRFAPFFEKDSSYFHPTAPRYGTIPGYVCLSGCGKHCTRHSSSAHNSLRPNQSPVCTPLPQSTNFTLPGPGFTLLRDSASDAEVFHLSALNSDMFTADDSRPPLDVVFVCVGGAGCAQQRGIGVAGPGRHRLLSVIANVMSDSVGFIFLKTASTQVDHARVLNMIRKFDLVSSYPFVAFRHRQLRALEVSANEDASGSFAPLPSAHFGSIHEGILVSRAAALAMLNAAMDESIVQHKETLPAACSEHLIFSDAWLCWCAASLDISAIDFVFGADSSGAMNEGRDCAANSALYGKLAQLYDQQRLSTSHHTYPPFTERTTLGFRYFMQSLVFHLAAGPRILHIPDNEQLGDSLFVDACCGQLLVDHMLSAAAPPAIAGLHPLLQHLSGALATAPNRSAFIAVMRAGFISSGVHGRESLNSSMSVVRRRMRLGVSATRVLGCSVLNNMQNSDNVPDAGTDSHDDLLHGHVADEELFRMHLITPAVMLSRLSQPVSRAFFLATHSEWTNIFGYNPVFSKDASLAFAAPDFGIQDWHFFCMLAVASSKRSAVPSFDAQSREYLACNAFSSAVWQRTYDAGLPRCFDLPPHVAGAVRYTGSVQAFSQYLSQCQGAASEEKLDDDPWMLRQLARAVQALLLERWDLQQVRPIPCLVRVLVTLICKQSWFQASLHLHSMLIMRADEFVESLQWNLCRGNVASITAVVEHGAAVEVYLRQLDVPLHDPHRKLHLQSIPGIYQCAPWPLLAPACSCVIAAHAGTTLASGLPTSA
jgi:hypothetical protein